MKTIKINQHVVRCRSVHRIDTGDRGYNASFAPYRDGYILLYRTGGILYGVKRAIKLGFLDEGLNLCTETRRICEGAHTDPRLLRVPEGYILTTSDQTRVHQWRINSRDGGLTFSGPKALEVQGLQMRDVERNWTPFVHEGKEYYIYSIDPFLVVTGDPGDCHVIAHSDPGIVWEAGIPSGGTPAARWNEDEFITFFHSFISSKRNHYHIPRYYFTGAVCFTSKPPFRITRYTPAPIEYEGLPDVANAKCPHRVLFPAGIVIEGDTVILSLGVNDIANVMVRIDRTEIEGAMVTAGTTREHDTRANGV